MAKRKRFVSLKIKLVITLAIALAVSSLVFVGAKEFGDFLVWRYYLDEETKQERAERYVKDFQDYVTSEKLRTTDSVKINNWSAGGFVEMMFYKDSTLIYAPEWFFEKMESESIAESVTESLSESIGESLSESLGDDGESQGESGGGAVESGESAFESSATENLTDESAESEGDESGESDESDSGSDSEESSIVAPPTENGWLSGDRGFMQYLSEEERADYTQRLKDILAGNNTMRPVEFVDGTLLVSVVDYTEEFVYAVVFSLSLMAALFVLLFIMIFTFTDMATRINRLANSVRQVESGNLDLTIKVAGNDEISALASDVNSMRNAVVDNMTKEKKAWETNAELITALSHDVRTPLTVMMGYLDLLELQNSDPSEEEYIIACKENAMKLKVLSDDMFSYFTAFGKNEIDPEAFTDNSTDFVRQMIAEHEILFVENGGSVVWENEIPEATLRLDTVYFGRVIDNIFSNIHKYAEMSAPVVIRSSISDGMLKLEFENTIKENDERAESNRIGIKTCVRIMEQLGGSFEHYSEDGVFTAAVTLPIKKK